jgi:hypothetical protein
MNTAEPEASRHQQVRPPTNTVEHERITLSIEEVATMLGEAAVFDIDLL